MDYKTLPQFMTKAIEDRTVTGIFAVHGNIDDGGDRSHPGAFSDYEVNGRNRVVHLWNHGGGWMDRGQTPPIAVVKAIAEISQENLPDAVKAFAPDATGGAEVTREYLDTASGNEILAGIKAGAITEMSYAYDVVEWKNVKTDDGDYIRDIFKMKLYDTSDVNWGMNPATLAGKNSSLLAGLSLADHFSTVHAAVLDLVERAEAVQDLREKDGRRLSTAHFDRLKSLYTSLADAQMRLAAITQPLEQPPVIDLARETERLKSQSSVLRLRIMNLGV